MKRKGLMRITAAFFGLMICFTILSRAAYQEGTALVHTGRPSSMVISHQVKTTGKVEQNQELAVTTEPNLRVASIAVGEGDRVSRGDLLFTLDLTMLEEKILNQKQEMEKQQLNVEDAKSQKDVSRQQKANEQAQASENYSLNTNRAGVALSRAARNLNQAREDLKEFRKSSGREEGDDTVEAALEADLEEKTQAYVDAVQELDSLKWQIENAVYQALQAAQGGTASLESRQTVPVYLRLTSGNQFGMDWQTLLSIVELRKGCSYIQIKGIHFFSGTQKKGTAKIREEIAYLDRRCRELEEEYGFSVETLEYGPGLSVAYFQGEEDRLLVDLQETAEALETMEWRGNVILEMGRALTACCGYYLTRICEVKQSDGKNYCMTDGGIHQLHYDGQIRGMYLPKIQMIPGSQEADEQEWTVCGALCTVNDLLLCRVRLAGAAIGKTLVFEQTGAYSATEGMALFLSRELPAVALYSRDMGWKQIRRRLPTYPWTMKKEDAEWKHC